MSATKTKKPAAEAVEEGKTNAATEALTDEEKQRRQEEQDKAFSPSSRTHVCTAAPACATWHGSLPCTTAESPTR